MAECILLKTRYSQEVMAGRSQMLSTGDLFSIEILQAFGLWTIIIKGASVQAKSLLLIPI